MANFRQLLGTLQSFFRIGGPGSAGLKSVDANTLEMRNATDAAQGRLRGADPLAAQDYVTKNHFDTVAPGVAPADAVKTVRLSVAASDGNTDSTTELPAGAIIHKVEAHFKTTAWDTGTLLVQSKDTTVTVMATSDNFPTTLAGYIIENDDTWSVSGTADDRKIRCIVAGTPTSGAAASVVVHYSEPGA